MILPDSSGGERGTRARSGHPPCRRTAHLRGARRDRRRRRAAVPRRAAAPLDAGALGIIPDGALAVARGRIVWLGPDADLEAAVALGPATRVIDAAGRVVMPGVVECHTHVVFGGDRAAEFQMRVAGQELPGDRRGRQAASGAPSATRGPRLARSSSTGVGVTWVGCSATG